MGPEVIASGNVSISCNDPIPQLASMGPEVIASGNIGQALGGRNHTSSFNGAGSDRFRK